MEITYHKRFIKQFKKLPPKVKKSFNDRVVFFEMHPFAPMLHNHAVDKAYPGYRSISITGDYRALFKENGNKVIFGFIGTHSELY